MFLLLLHSLFLPLLHASKSPLEEAEGLFAIYHKALSNSNSNKQLELILSNNFEIDNCGRSKISRDDLINSMKLNRTNVLMRMHRFIDAYESHNESILINMATGDDMFIIQLQMKKFDGKMLLDSEKITQCGRNITMTSSLVDDAKMMAEKVVKDYIAELTTPGLKDLEMLAPSYIMDRCGVHYTREKVVEVIRSLEGRSNRRLDSFPTLREAITEDFKGTFLVNIFDEDFGEVITFDVDFSADGKHKILYEYHGICYIQDVVLPFLKLSDSFANRLGNKYNLAYRWNDIDEFKNVTSSSFKCNGHILSRDEFWLIKGAGLFYYCKIIALYMFEGEGEFLCEHNARFFAKRIDGVFKITEVKRETCVKRDLYSQLMRSHLQETVDNYIDGVNNKSYEKVGKLKIDGQDFDGNFNRFYPNIKMPKMSVLLKDFNPQSSVYQFIGRAPWTIFNWTAYRNYNLKFTLTHENRRSFDKSMSWKQDYEESFEIGKLSLRDTFKDRTVGTVARTLIRLYTIAIKAKCRDLFEKVTSEDFRVIHLVHHQRDVDLGISRNSYFATFYSDVLIANPERRYYNFDIKNGDLEFWIDVGVTEVMFKARLIDNYYRIISEHRTFSEKDVQFMKFEAKINALIKNQK